MMRERYYEGAKGVIVSLASWGGWAPKEGGSELLNGWPESGWTGIHGRRSFAGYLVGIAAFSF